MVICAETAFTAYSAFIIPVFHQKNNPQIMNGAVPAAEYFRCLIRDGRPRSDGLDCENNSLSGRGCYMVRILGIFSKRTLLRRSVQ